MIDSDINTALRPIFGTEVHPQRRRQPDGVVDLPLLPAAIYEKVSDSWVEAATMCGISDTHNVRLQVDVYARPYKRCLQLAEEAALALDPFGLRLTKQCFPEDPDRASRVLLEYSIWEAADIEIPEPAMPLELASISPTSARGGDPTLVLSLFGQFALGDIVECVGFGVMPTAQVSATELQAVAASACFVVDGASFDVVVHRAAEVSAAMPFQVLNAPEPASVDPLTLEEGAGSATVTVTGTSFLSGDVIVIDGEPQTTVVDSATALHCAYTATGAAGDVLPVQVRHQAADGAWLYTPRSSAPEITIVEVPPMLLGGFAAGFDGGFG
jgi:hypothetical protein